MGTGGGTGADDKTRETRETLGHKTESENRYNIKQETKLIIMTLLLFCCCSAAMCDSVCDCVCVLVLRYNERGLSVVTAGWDERKDRRRRNNDKQMRPGSAKGWSFSR